MEIKGGLTPLQENVLAEKLTRLGADKDTIRISGDILGDGQKPVFWPDTVYLRIEFIPEHFDNFTARTLIGGNPLTNLKIAVEGSAISSHAKSEGNN